MNYKHVAQTVAAVGASVALVLTLIFTLGPGTHQHSPVTSTPAAHRPSSPQRLKTHAHLAHESSTARQAECSNVPVESRFDCSPGRQLNQSSCEARGCCWKVPLSQELPLPPFCYYPPSFRGYSFVNLTEEKHGLTGFLTLQAGSGYPGDAALLRMDVFYETNTRLRIKIRDATRERWEPPVPVVPVVNTSANSPYYTFKAHMSDGAFTVSRKSNNQTVFSTLGMAPLAFAEQFVQVSTRLASHFVYGLGEHHDGLLLNTSWTRRTLWNNDNSPSPGKNVYGSHPFYLALEPNGQAHGVFLLNSNALEAELQPLPALTLRATGGIVDLYVLLGTTPQSVVSEYTEVVGFPFLPPYWALGYHQCRYNYKTLNKTREVWQRTRDAGIPFDTQWNDIDYMDDFKDFTYDHVAYAGLPQFVDEVHQAGMHYVAIVDPGLSATEPPGTYPPLDQGLELGVFVRNSSNLPFVGKVWNPNATVFPDFSHPLIVPYWAEQFQRYHGQVPLDGVWIDMNEPSNQLSGSMDGCNDSSINQPPFLPSTLDGGLLYYHTLCPDARHYAGLHYDLHNLYGLQEAITVYDTIELELVKRPFIISRSTFAGQGRYSGHWTGDIWSNWFEMARSIPGVLNFNMFGVPMVGADMCGFLGNTTVELCARWMQLGAFYPFSRNHNNNNNMDQDPVALGPEVVEAARNALTQRYFLLPYLYSLFFKAHMTGAPVARPLFMEYPHLPETYAIDTQFMWGSALMVVPVLQESATTVSAFLPLEQWYDWYDGTSVKGPGAQVTLDAPLNKIPLLIRGGSILPIQTPGNTTTQSLQNPRGLVVAPDAEGRAVGELYWDDGDSLGTLHGSFYSHIQFNSSSNAVAANCTFSGHKAPIFLEYAYILHVSSNITEARVGGKVAPFDYLQPQQVLYIHSFNQSLLTAFNITWQL